jgi:hypothetical protein
MKKAILLLAVAAVAAPLAASATDVEVSADVFSAYVSRGSVLNDEPVFQPNIWFGAPAGFDFNLWATMDLSDNDKSCAPNTRGRWSEFDFTLGWSPDFLLEDAPISIWIGSTYYTYPQDTCDNDYDAAIKLTGNCILNPWIRFVHECDASDNVRFDIGISHTFDLADTVTLKLSGESTFGFDGWMEKWNRVESSEGPDGETISENTVVEGGDAGFADIMVMATLGWQVTDAWSVALKGGFSTLIDSDARDAADFDDIDSDIFYAGISTAYTF